MPNVLVVDDVSTDRLLAGGLFEEEPDWHVDYATNGKEAVERMSTQEPDVVVTDLQMPEMNGLDLVKAVVRKFPNIPVVLMTSQGSEEIAVQALESGAASYLPKRILGSELLRLVDRVTKASQDEQTHHRLMTRVNRLESAELENDLALLSSMARHLRSSIVSFGLCVESDSVRIGTALDEALTNAYYHGNLELDSTLRHQDTDEYYNLARQRSQDDSYRDRRVRVRSELSPSEVVITISDDGGGFDPADLPDPTDPEYICRPYGRGVMLMRTFMDDVRFNDKGNEVTLIKRRQSK